MDIRQLFYCLRWHECVYSQSPRSVLEIYFNLNDMTRVHRAVESTGYIHLCITYTRVCKAKDRSSVYTSIALWNLGHYI